MAERQGEAWISCRCFGRWLGRLDSGRGCENTGLGRGNTNWAYSLFFG